MIPNGSAPPASVDGRDNGERDESDANVNAELVFLLERAGIVLSPERIAAVAAEYVAFRKELALVNGAYTAQDEPALIFVAGSRIARG